MHVLLRQRTQRHTTRGNTMTAQSDRRFARHAERSCRRSIDPLVRSCPTPAGCWRGGSAMAGRGRLGLGGQMCGRWCCRRCGSFGKPILNHQGSQHSDILENHICARHTRCIPYPVSPSSPHTHYKRHSKRAEKEIELCMFYYLSGAVL